MNNDIGSRSRSGTHEMSTPRRSGKTALTAALRKEPMRWFRGVLDAWEDRP